MLGRICAVLFALCWVGCDGSGGVESAHGPAHHQALPADEPLSGTSLFHLDSTWSDQDGRSLALRQLSGRVVVLAMVYTHCESACPRIIADMRRIRGELGPAADRVALVLVSIDPDRDTPERLREFGSETGLSEAGWTLLRGDEDDVRELAAVLGVQYRRTTDEDFAHSNVIHVLDAEGEIAHQQRGLGADPKATVEVLRELLLSSEER